MEHWRGASSTADVDTLAVSDNHAGGGFEGQQTSPQSDASNVASDDSSSPPALAQVASGAAASGAGGTGAPVTPLRQIGDVSGGSAMPVNGSGSYMLYVGDSGAFDETPSSSGGSSTPDAGSTGSDPGAGSSAPTGASAPAGNTLSASPDSTSSIIPTEAGLGIYLPGSPSAVATFATWLGAAPQYALGYFSDTSWSNFVSEGEWLIGQWSSQLPSQAMIWGMPLNMADGTSTLAEVAAGQFNSDYLQIAQALVADGEANSFIRLGWEFNGGWYPWSPGATGAATFIAAFQDVVNVLRSVPGENFKIVWNPNNGQGQVNPAKCYPGNAYVDYIAEDVYDQYWGPNNTPVTSDTTRWSDIESQSFGLNWFVSFAASEGKPIGLGEWGVVTRTDGFGGGDDPYFVQQMAAFIKTNNVAFADYWDGGSGGFDSSLADHPLSQAAFLAAFGGSTLSTGSLAQPKLNTSTSLSLGNARVGGTLSQALSISNSASPPAESLDVSLGGTTGSATSSGSISLLGAGATNSSSIVVGLGTTAAGALSGTVTLGYLSDGSGTDGSGTTSLGTSKLTLSGTVYREATASASVSSTPLVFHVGGSGSVALTVTNTAANDGYSEDLIATVGTVTGVTASGATGDIVAQGASSAITATVSTASAGTISGSVKLNLQSDGTGIDGFGAIADGTATVAINATVDNYAVAAFEKVSGTGTLSQSGTSYTLSLGSVTLGASPVTVGLGVLNNVTGPADLLSGSFATSSSSAFSLSGLGAFSNLAAGQADTSPSVTLATNTAGTFSEIITLTSTGSNSSGYAGALTAETLVITGTITSSSGSAAWTGPGGANRSGSFNTAADWSPASVPSSKTTVTIGNSGTYTLTSSQSNAVAALTLSDSAATLAVTGGTFDVLASSTNAGQITVADAASLELAGTMTDFGRDRAQFDRRCDRSRRQRQRNAQGRGPAQSFQFDGQRDREQQRGRDAHQFIDHRRRGHDRRRESHPRQLERRRDRCHRQYSGAHACRFRRHHQFRAHRGDRQRRSHHRRGTRQQRHARSDQGRIQSVVIGDGNRVRGDRRRNAHFGGLRVGDPGRGVWCGGHRHARSGARPELRRHGRRPHNRRRHRPHEFPVRGRSESQQGHRHHAERQNHRRGGDRQGQYAHGHHRSAEPGRHRLFEQRQRLHLDERQFRQRPRRHVAGAGRGPLTRQGTRAGSSGERKISI